MPSSRMHEVTDWGGEGQLSCDESSGVSIVVRLWASEVCAQVIFSGPNFGAYRNKDQDSRQPIVTSSLK